MEFLLLFRPLLIQHRLKEIWMVQKVNHFLPLKLQINPRSQIKWRGKSRKGGAGSVKKEVKKVIIIIIFLFNNRIFFQGLFLFGRENN